VDEKAPSPLRSAGALQDAVARFRASNLAKLLECGGKRSATPLWDAAEPRGVRAKNAVAAARRQKN